MIKHQRKGVGMFAKIILKSIYEKHGVCTGSCYIFVYQKNTNFFVPNCKEFGDRHF
jgi:hypothetical protein